MARFDVPIPIMGVPTGNQNIPYLIAIVTMALLGIFGVIGVLILRPHEDNASLYVAIAGFIGPTTGAMMAFMKTQETHGLVNSRMDEFKRLLVANASVQAELENEKRLSRELRADAAKVKA